MRAPVTALKSGTDIETLGAPEHLLHALHAPQLLLVFAAHELGWPVQPPELQPQVALHALQHLPEDCAAQQPPPQQPPVLHAPPHCVCTACLQDSGDAVSVLRK